MPKRGREKGRKKGKKRKIWKTDSITCARKPLPFKARKKTYTKNLQLAKLKRKKRTVGVV